jgi:hypothetical protein
MKKLLPWIFGIFLLFTVSVSAEECKEQKEEDACKELSKSCTWMKSLKKCISPEELKKLKEQGGKAVGTRLRGDLEEE